MKQKRKSTVSVPLWLLIERKGKREMVVHVTDQTGQLQCRCAFHPTQIVLVYGGAIKEKDSHLRSKLCPACKSYVKSNEHGW